MKLSFYSSTIRQIKADAAVMLVFENKSDRESLVRDIQKYLGKKITEIVDLEKFEGKKEELLTLFTERKINSPRLILAGLGPKEDLSIEQYRRTAAAAAVHASTLKVKHVTFNVPSSPDSFSLSETVKAIAEGAYLSLYKFDKYISEKKKNAISQISLFHPDKAMIKELGKTVNEANIICEATCLARDLSNAPGNEIYPESLAKAAKESGSKYGYKVTVWDNNKIEKAGFGGLAAVSKGSSRQARFIIIEHNHLHTGLDTVVLIGKGITFDSGGISIKPSNGMEEMKMDMSGAAAVIGIVEAASRLKLPLHIVGLIPAAENLPGGSALKPGDVIRHYGGKTSEVVNTDAEGRLILADAIAYAVNYKPKAVIDIATLTGACVVALGHHATGMLGNSEDLMGKLKFAGEKTFERVWQLPLYDEYEKQIKSNIADVKNVGGKWAGAITAALFLKNFIPKDKKFNWVHLDIAGSAMLEENLPYAPKGGSGVGVRLLTEFFRDWQNK